LISVLHHLPPPDTSLRRRAGYREVNTEEDEEVQVSVTPGTGDTVEELTSGEQEIVQHHGWSNLVWSFLASSLMTVRNFHKCHLPSR
jgi:hypothetical protein